MTDRATAGPYTLVIPPNGRATLFEADGAGVDHEVPFGVNNLDALVQFAGEVIRLNGVLEEFRTRCCCCRVAVRRLRSALTAARRFVEWHGDPNARREMLTRIDAALSAANGGSSS
jgi:hypothetical protein